MSVSRGEECGESRVSVRSGSERRVFVRGSE